MDWTLTIIEMSLSFLPMIIITVISLEFDWRLERALLALGLCAVFAFGVLFVVVEPNLQADQNAMCESYFNINDAKFETQGYSSFCVFNGEAHKVTVLDNQIVKIV